MKKEFNAKFTSISKAAFDKLQSKINDFAKELEAAKTNTKTPITKEDLLKKLVVVNTALEFCNDQWKKAIEKLASDSFEDAMAKWDKETKAKVKRAKAKIIIKALVGVAFSLGVAAMAIVVAVASHGVAAPVMIPAAIGAALAGVNALIQVKNVMTSGIGTAASLCDAKTKEVKADLAAVQGTIDELGKYNFATMTPEEAAKVKVGIKQKVRVGWSLLEKHAGQLEKFHRELAIKIDERQNWLDGQNAKMKDGNENEAKTIQAQVDQLSNRLKGLKKRVDDLSGLETQCAGALAIIEDAVDKGILPKYDKFRGLVDAMGQLGDTMSPILTSAPRSRVRLPLT